MNFFRDGLFTAGLLFSASAGAADFNNISGYTTPLAVMAAQRVQDGQKPGWFIAQPASAQLVTNNAIAAVPASYNEGQLNTAMPSATLAAATDLGVPDSSDASSELKLRGTAANQGMAAFMTWLGAAQQNHAGKSVMARAAMPSVTLAAATDLGVPDSSDASSELKLREATAPKSMFELMDADQWNLQAASNGWAATDQIIEFGG